MIDAVVVLGLVGALVASTFKWGYWTLGVVVLFYVLSVAHKPSFETDSNNSRTSINVVFLAARTHVAFPGRYRSGALYIGFLWSIYPIVWALCDGGNVISPTGEMIWYGLLDLLSGPVFLYFYLWGARTINYNALGFQSGKATDYAVGPSGTGAASGAAPREKELRDPGGTNPGPAAAGTDPGYNPGHAGAHTATGPSV